MNTTEFEGGRSLIRYVQQFYERGWMWATAGNLSLRLESSEVKFIVTPSGVPKGDLKPEHLIVIGDKTPRWLGDYMHSDGRPPIPSAETRVHQMFYEILPECEAVFHVHPAAATYISGVFGDPTEQRLLRLPWIEIMKAVGFEEGSIAYLPIFSNFQDITKLADEVKRFWQSTSEKKIPAILIFNHGVTAWGKTMDEARNHLEAIEFICDQQYRAMCASAKPTTAPSSR